MLNIPVGQLNYILCKKLSKTRLKEAKILLSKQQHSGAYYLAGYSIEMAIKAYYCKGNKFPPKPNVVKQLYIHDFNNLMTTTGLKEEFKKDIKTNQLLQSAWSDIKDWTEESRYSIIKYKDVKSFINSAEIVLQWIQTKW